MTNKKTLSIFLFFLLQVFYLDAYGLPREIDEKISSKDKSEKNYFPTTTIKGNLSLLKALTSKSTLLFGTNLQTLK